MANQFRRFSKVAFVFGTVVAGLFLILSVASVLALRWLTPPTSSFMLQARADVDATQDLAYAWAPWDEIASPMRLAVVASEDQKFPVHRGFDIGAIEEALDENQRRNVPRGASTISQQTAKNLFLWPGRSYFRKGLEAYFTVLLETLWPKRRILEVYLNIAEFGEGTFGAEAAAQRFYSKRAIDLTEPEAATLAAVLPNPKKLRAAAPSAYVQERSIWIQDQMRMLGPGYLAEL